MSGQTMERFMEQLAQGIKRAGGAREWDDAKASALAAEALAKLRAMGPFVYPNLFEIGELRFVYQWDENPAVLIIMIWDDHMWQDVVHVELPPELV